jgi:hypothetical protein
VDEPDEALMPPRDAELPMPSSLRLPRSLRLPSWLLPELPELPELPLELWSPQLLSPPFALLSL